MLKPRPDEYNALFFKKSWDVIKYDFIAAIKYFFSNNFLPRCANAIRVALVPKQEHSVCLNDFRPISCCNVLYKCIAKLLVIRLKAALIDVIGLSQYAFIPGRNISDAILLTQELMHNYHHNKGPSRCALKIDLKKAFDTVSLDFILAGLHAIGIPHDMVNWIKTCITTVHYTININGELHVFFQATRGIRQGDPLSPYLFVLAMEGLSGIIHQSICSSTFQYHWRCQPTKITHLCFADNLMMFCHDRFRV
jgi:mannosylglycoprotein endo-beta-mannosidase